MAKWGQGDPRWLVEERPDATNVNNWHWTENNASNWSKVKLMELFIGLKVHSDIGTVEIIEMLKCNGDAVVYNRRGKLACFYEWHFEMKWMGICNQNEVIVEGRIAVLNVTEENDLNDTDVVVYYEDDGAESTVFGNVMQNQGAKLIKGQLLLYIKALKEDFSKDLILPTIHDPVPEIMPGIKERKTFFQWNECEQKDSGKTFPPNLNSSNICSKEIFKCTAEELYNVLTVKELVQAFTKSDCIVEPKEGGKFLLFDGNVQGYFIKLQPFNIIELKWRFKTWPKDHFSDVLINIDQKSDCTEIVLEQAGIPDNEVERTKEGWKRHYWDSIKKTFGFGMLLF